MRTLKALFISGILILYALQCKIKSTQEKPEFQKKWISAEMTSKYHSETFQVPYSVYFPDANKIPEGGFPLLIALHGWNLHMEEWKKSGISELADEFGIMIVTPQMGKANYEREYFPETIMKWNPKPSGEWVGKDFLEYIQNHYPVSKDRDNTGILGVSTGGHGAVLVAGYFPEKFGYASSISGDFDVTKTPNDNLSKNIFGAYDKFPQRWKNGSSISLLNNYSRTKIYLGHGTLDSISTVEQSRLMARELKKHNFNYIYHEDTNAGHDWNYWKSELKPAIEFFINRN